jgi:hypothetical protein
MSCSKPENPFSNMKVTTTSKRNIITIDENTPQGATFEQFGDNSLVIVRESAAGVTIIQHGVGSTVELEVLLVGGSIVQWGADSVIKFIGDVPDNVSIVQTGSECDVKLTGEVPTGLTVEQSNDSTFTFNGVCIPGSYADSESIEAALK